MASANEVRIRLHPYRKTVAGASNAGASWTERRGILLELWAEGRRGWGEAAPLPGYSPDDLESARQALSEMPGTCFSEMPGTFSEMPGTLAEIRDRVDRIDPPSARFALETALLDWLGRRLDLPVPALLTGDDGARWTRPSVQSLWVGGPDLEPGPGALELGQGPLKVKVGRAGAFERELAMLTGLRREHPELELRLDANGAWSAAEAPGRLERLAKLGIRWIEEPIRPRSVDELAALIRDSPVPVAVDESLWRLSLGPRDLAELRPAAVVWKPQVLGGCLRCLDLAAATEAPALASHTFDGPVAFAAARALAAALDHGSSSPAAHGLAPHGALDAWPAEASALPRADAPGLGLEWTPP